MAGSLNAALAALAFLGVFQPVSARASDKLTPEHFQNRIRISDDSLDTVATLSTVDGYQVRHGLLRIVWDDNFLRATIDKKTGETHFQLYQHVAYSGSWHFYERVNYETPDGPKEAQITQISHDVGPCDNGCTLMEDFGFDVPEALLRTIAARYVPDGKDLWNFKFTAKDGAVWQDGLMPAEAAGMLAAVDAYKAEHGLAVTR